ncbi:hypothetical protein [Methylopila sp. M107]|uniref:hypothetical protein n=1 Tax=Methylopila sp. M107 TaxID=1101190 RepID=UPI000360BE05|nr:hypothetical protein [Methylopila sp. M107]
MASVVVVTTSAPLVTAAQAKAATCVLAADDDATVMALLAVAQTAVEAPSWIGSSLGKQTLELRTSCWAYLLGTSCRLPYGPTLRIVEVKYLDTSGVEQTLDPAKYDLADAGTASSRIVLRSGEALPAVADAWNAIRVQYEAGHEASDPRLVTAKHAIILSAVQLRSLSASDLALRTVDVPGLESRTYTVSDAAERLVRNAVENLLSGFRVYAI